MKGAKNRSSPATRRARARLTEAERKALDGATRYLVREPDGRVHVTVRLADVPEVGLPVKELVEKRDFDTLLADDSGLHAATDLQLGVTLSPEGAGIYRLKGYADLDVTHPCVRCLEDVRFPLELNLDLRLHEGRAELLPDEKVDVESAGMRKLTHEDDDDGYLGIDDDEDFVTFEGGAVELLSVVREQVLLALPMHPSCESTGAVTSGPCRFDELKTQASGAGLEGDPRWQGLKLWAERHNRPS